MNLRWPVKWTIEDQNTRERFAGVQFNEKLYIAYRALVGDNIWLTYTKDDQEHEYGRKWEKTTVLTEKTQGAPALNLYNNKMHLAYRTVDTNQIRIASTEDGEKWDKIENLNDRPITAPSLTTYKNKQYIAYGQDLGSARSKIAIGEYMDGQGWVINEIKDHYTKTEPSLTVYNNMLYLAYKSDDGYDQICVSKSSDGKSWTKEEIEIKKTKYAPALQEIKGVLYLVFGDNDDNIIYMVKQGELWREQEKVDGEKISAAPSLTKFKTIGENELALIGWSGKFNDKINCKVIII
ncbi:MAG: hypothetical protein Fur006_17070 [Coleofasciculaceae cyanobacterium]